MGKLAQGQLVWPGVLLVVIASFSDRVYCWQETTVCSSTTSSEPLSCTSSQWVQILSETYAPQTDGATMCQLNSSSCNAYYYDTGMEASCNGPASRGPCREHVDVDGARRMSRCLQDVSHVATLIQYSCIQGSAVLNVCEAVNRTMRTSDLPVYLASPGYTQATPAGRMCTCTIQGSNLKMNAVEVNVMSELPWSGSATDGIYSDVFSVSSGTTVLWRSGDCVGCVRNVLVNTNLFVPVEETRYPNVSLTYSDFGVPGQNVWLEILELGPHISVSCHSAPLPLDRLIPVPTTIATTTPSRTDRSTLPHIATVAPSVGTGVTTPSSTGITSTDQETVTVPSGDRWTTRQGDLETDRQTKQTTTSLQSGDSGTTRIGDLTSDKEDNSNDETTLIAILTVIAVVLAAASVFIGVLIYRKRHSLKSDDQITSCAVITSCCHRNVHEKQSRSAHVEGINNGNFDSIAEPKKSIQHSAGQSSYTTHGSGQITPDTPGPGQQGEDVSIDTNSCFIPRELRECHRQIIAAQLDQMRLDRTSKDALMSSANVEASLRTDRSHNESSL